MADVALSDTGRDDVVPSMPASFRERRMHQLAPALAVDHLFPQGVGVPLLFGNRLPSAMRSLGKGITEFKKGVKGIEDEVEDVARVEDTGTKQEPASR